MSKYDQLDYVSNFEMKKKTYPECVKDLSEKIVLIPEELLAVTVEQFKTCLKLETQKQNRNFIFFNNNQTVIKQDYLNNAKYFKDDMSPDEKKELLIDYIIYNYPGNVDANYFKTNLTKVFQFDKNYEVEDFESMIKNYFQKDSINLNDEEDRKKFKEIIEDNIKIIYENDNINNSLNSSLRDNN